jgi:hypothetical protein
MVGHLKEQRTVPGLVGVAKEKHGKKGLACSVLVFGLLCFGPRTVGWGVRQDKGASVMLDDISPSCHGLAIIIDTLVGMLATGKKFLVSLHECVDSVTAIVELKRDGQYGGQKPCTLTISCVFLESGEGLKLGFHSVRALTYDGVPQRHEVTAKLKAAGNKLFNFLLED